MTTVWLACGVWRRRRVKAQAVRVRDVLQRAAERLVRSGSGWGWLLLCLTAPAWAPLTYGGYFELARGFLPLANLRALLQSGLSLGWAPAIGQPYDLWRGEGMLPYLLAAAWRLPGLADLDAIKACFGFSLVCGALGVYYRQGWRDRQAGPADATWAGPRHLPALVAGVLYALWPYGLGVVYGRGALAEACLLALLPWVWWAAEVVAAGECCRVRARGALGALLAAALWMQAGLALWLIGLVLIYLVISAFRSERRGLDRWAGLLVWAGGLALGLIGLLPVIAARGWGDTPWATFAEHFSDLGQLLAPVWGAGGSSAGRAALQPLSLGLTACGLAMLGAILPIVTPHAGSPAISSAAGGKTAPRAHVMNRWLGWGCAVVLVLLSTGLAAPLWRLLPALARTLTYPWQLQLLVGPWLAWGAGSGVRALLAQGPAPMDGETPVPVRTPVVLGAVLLLVGVLEVYPFLDRPAVAAPAGPIVIFGQDEIALLDAGVTGLPAPGGPITATVRWQALRPLSSDYTVFFQAVGANGQLLGQVDTMPRANQLLTSQWRPGQVISDTYTLSLKAASPDRYYLGLYLWQTGARLPAGADDKVVLRP